MQQTGQYAGFFDAAAEDETAQAVSIASVIGGVIQDMADPFFTGQVLYGGRFIQQLPIHGNIGNAVIMERYEHVFCQRLMEADFIGDMMMKQFVDIEVVGSFRRGRHAQPEPGLEIAEYPLV